MKKQRRKKEPKQPKQKKKFKDTGLAKLMNEFSNATKSEKSDVAFSSKYAGKEIKIKSKRIRQDKEKKSNILPLVGILAAALLFKG